MSFVSTVLNDGTRVTLRSSKAFDAIAYDVATYTAFFLAFDRPDISEAIRQRWKKLCENMPGHASEVASGDQIAMRVEPTSESIAFIAWVKSLGDLGLPEFIAQMETDLRPELDAAGVKLGG